MVQIEEITDQEAAEIYRIQGNDAFRSGQYEQAISYYSEAMQYQRDNASLFTNRAAAYLKTDNCLGAEQDCSRAIELDPKNPKAFNRRGQARQALGDLDGAIEDFQIALQLLADSTIEANLKAVLKLRDDIQHEKVHTKEVKQAEVERQREHVDIEATREEAKNLFKDGLFEQAVVKYSAILEGHTEHPLTDLERATFLNNRAACFIQMKAEQDAIRDLTAVLEIDPYNNKARLRRALTYENLEQYGRAFDDFRLLLQTEHSSSTTASEAIRRLSQHFPELKQRPIPELPQRN
eukprot:c19677_g1_i1.p1 GENE.c19677_g1_i1~~c19677_g1_i1.p1  ORF type:complete len:293 (+),score=89.22 c19677_g1_i1:43-921(+)